MTVGYLFFAVSTALLCSGMWVLSGGSLLTGALIYLASGQIAMMALIGFSVIALDRDKARR